MAVRFAVVVVSYNPREKLAMTLESILSQQDADYRVIVKDAGSKDQAVEHAKEKYSDARIKWVVARDEGIYDGMNQAVAQLDPAKDDWVFFLNCGDAFADSRVLSRVDEAIRADQERLADKEKPLIYYGNIRERRTGRCVTANPRMDAFACYRHVPNHQACFYSVALMRREPYDSRWRVRGDYEHFLRCFFHKNARPTAVDLLITDYEGGGFSESGEGRAISAKEHREITAMYFTGRQRFLYRLALILSLQPLRRRLADDPRTAGWYHGLRTRLMERRKRRDEGR